MRLLFFARPAPPRTPLTPSIDRLCHDIALDEPVDVMTNWIDACKEENEGFAGDDY